MATYTGTADGSGNFSIDFGGNSYASAQKVIVTAEKSGATKTIELFAPADTTGGGAIQFSGNLNNFPLNIGDVTLNGLSGAIQNYAFEMSGQNYSLAKVATGLTINNGPTSVGERAFYYWSSATKLILANTITSISAGAFYRWSSLLSCVIPDSVTSIGVDACRLWGAATSVTIGSSVATIGANGFQGLSSCNELILKPSTPPSISSNTFTGLNATCVIKVPSSALTAYQTATNWSAYAAQMVGI